MSAEFACDGFWPWQYRSSYCPDNFTNPGYKLTYFFNRRRGIRVEQTVVPDLHKAMWKDVLKKAPYKFHGIKRHGAEAVAA